ncbi:MAG: head GIN domain-containing protein [Archangium sp.]|nr:head GIN domain-containing protein [Archangium sp.]
MSPLIRSAFFTLSALAFGACAMEVGNGHVVPQQRTVSAFSKVSVGSGIRATIARGDRAVTLTADENLHAFLQVFVENDTLIVRKVPNFTLNPTATIVADISNPLLVGLDVSGGAHVNADATEAVEWRLNASGGSTAALSRLEATQVIVNASGGSHVDVFGLAQSAIVDASGGSQVDTDGVAAQDVTVNASGGSTLHVRASKSAQGNASGGSTVTVTGNPLTRSIDTSGGSRVTYSGNE